MSENVVPLPVWKKGETAEEWFHEMALFARLYPERFNRMVLVYAEDTGKGSDKIDYYCNNVSTLEIVGLLSIGIDKVNQRTGR